MRVVRGIEEMGHEVEGFGLGGEGYTWALTIRPGSKADREVREGVAFLLDLLVWDVWMEMAGLGPKFKTNNVLGLS